MAAPSNDKSLALYCDFENIALGVRDAKYQKFDISHILERLLVKGSIVVKKAYCDWDRYKNFKGAMHEAAFELIEIPHVRMSGKNSADIRMVVDALDLCYTKSHVDTFVIISGDSDFSPLVSKLRENAKTVIGVGVKNSTSDLLISSCDEFIYYDDLVREIERSRRPASKKRASKKRASRAKTETKVDEQSESDEDDQTAADASDGGSGAAADTGASTEAATRTADVGDEAGTDTAGTAKDAKKRGSRSRSKTKAKSATDGKGEKAGEGRDEEADADAPKRPRRDRRAAGGASPLVEEATEGVSGSAAGDGAAASDGVVSDEGASGDGAPDESASDEPAEDSTPEELAQEGLDMLLETALALYSERGGEDKLWGSMVKQTLKRRRPGFNESYYGFDSFGRMLEEAAARGHLALEHDDRSGGYIITRISA